MCSLRTATICDMNCLIYYKVLLVLTKDIYDGARLDICMEQFYSELTILIYTDIICVKHFSRKS